MKGLMQLIMNSLETDSLKLSSTLPKLRTLELVGNHLNSSVLPHLWALPSLESLDLNYNQIGLIQLNGKATGSYISKSPVYRTKSIVHAPFQIWRDSKIWSNCFYETMELMASLQTVSSFASFLIIPFPDNTILSAGFPVPVYCPSIQ